MKTKAVPAKEIVLIVYDFDGVLTDNRVLVFSDGNEAVFCNRSDGLAIEKIRKIGIPQLILSKEKNSVVKARAKKLNIDVLSGIDSKDVVLKEFCKQKGFALKKVLYVGNDTNDLEAMKLVGYPVAPADANHDILKIAEIIVPVNGGYGVIKHLFDNYLKTG